MAGYFAPSLRNIIQRSNRFCGATDNASAYGAEDSVDPGRIVCLITIPVIIFVHEAIRKKLKKKFF